MAVKKRGAKQGAAEVPATEPKEPAGTFFSPSDTRAAGSDQPTEIERPASFRKPTRTFFDAGHRDPLFSLSTHRAPQVITAEQRQERVEAEQAKVRRGTEWLMSVLTRR
ncbi:hypothetical protein PQQ64_25630 [Paraburkholderia graminis]|uniref:hypothetical protein n=1 Tax=Paraburkholderia graminis TaxID=60548 RepID=UPI0038BC620C